MLIILQVQNFRKVEKSTQNSQLSQHLDARGINKHFHYLTWITHNVFMWIGVSVFIYISMSMGVCTHTYAYIFSVFAFDLFILMLLLPLFFFSSFTLIFVQTWGNTMKIRHFSLFCVILVIPLKWTDNLGRVVVVSLRKLVKYLK